MHKANRRRVAATAALVKVNWRNDTSVVGVVVGVLASSVIVSGSNDEDSDWPPSGIVQERHKAKIMDLMPKTMEDGNGCAMSFSVQLNYYNNKEKEDNNGCVMSFSAQLAAGSSGSAVLPLENQSQSQARGRVTKEIPANGQSEGPPLMPGLHPLVSWTHEAPSYNEISSHSLCLPMQRSHGHVGKSSARRCASLHLYPSLQHDSFP